MVVICRLRLIVAWLLLDFSCINCWCLLSLLLFIWFPADRRRPCWCFFCCSCCRLLLLIVISNGCCFQLLQFSFLVNDSSFVLLLLLLPICWYFCSCCWLMCCCWRLLANNYCHSCCWQVPPTVADRCLLLKLLLPMTVAYLASAVERYVVCVAANCCLFKFCLVLRMLFIVAFYCWQKLRLLASAAAATVYLVLLLSLTSYIDCCSLVLVFFLFRVVLTVCWGCRSQVDCRRSPFAGRPSTVTG